MRGWKNSNLVIVAVLGVLVLCGTGWASLTDGLIAHWEFEEDSGSTAYDSADNNHGFIYGAERVAGQIGNALDFDGDDDYVDIPYNPSLDIDAPSGISVSVWMKLRSYPDISHQGPIFGLYNNQAGVGGTKNYLLIHKSVYGNTLAWDQYPPSYGWLDSIKPDLDTWYHVAVVQDSTYRAIYINGVLDSSDNSPDLYAGGAPDTIRIGNRTDSVASYSFDGKIDDVRIYDRALSAEEIEQLSLTGLAGLEIVGPDEVAENSHAQYQAIAHYNNGNTKDVTDLADWSVEPNDNCSIAAGLLTTEMIDLPTDITITADYNENGSIEVGQKQVSILAICPSGSALEFDGVDDRLIIADADSLTPHDEITISFWAYKADGDAVAIYKYASCPNEQNSPGNSRSYRIGAQDLAGLKIFSSLNNSDEIKTINTVPANQWFHIAATFNRGEAAIYINGLLDNAETLSVSSIMNDAQPLIIGGYWYYCGADTFINRLNGIIDDVRIYNRALTAEEIRAGVHTKPDVYDPNLVGYWDFDEGEGQIAYDLSGNGNDGQLGSGSGGDDNDPNWVDSDAPIGICTLYGLVEQNLNDILDRKLSILDELGILLGKEKALFGYMDEAFHNDELDNLNKNDVVKAKQKIMGAIQHEEQAESSVDQSIEKLEEALNALD